VKLYTFFRSSAAYRVRIALNLKGLSYESVAVHLARDGGQHKTAEFRAINPQMRVPALALSNGDTLIQSLAIIEYLDEVFPDPPLLPVDAIERSRARAIAQIVACDIHPLNNSGTMAYLRNVMAQDDAAIAAWYAFWVTAAFQTIEAMIDPSPFIFGAHPGLGEIFIVPQAYNARRFNVPLDPFPKIVALDAICRKLPAFEHALPENQPDAE
jgi:maleylpyruvate isomerase